MATILIVDDRATNRDFLATLLGYGAHRVLQAEDGGAALDLARAEHPDLILSDILMPTMDGDELVRQLRADPDIAQIAVVFTFAHYLDREARALAESCGVTHILPKPCEPDAVLEVVNTVLASAPRVPRSVPAPTFEHDHLRLVTDKLRTQTVELQLANKLTTLIEVSQQLALERDPDRLFREFTRAARQIIGARFALVARSDSVRHAETEFFASGMELPNAGAWPRGTVADALDTLLAFPGTYRTPAGGNTPVDGMPDRHPPVRALLACSIVSLQRIYGWVCLTDKVGFDAFGEDDERLLSILGAQLGRIYENGCLYQDLQARTAELEREVEERSVAEAVVGVRARAALLVAEVGVSLTRGGTLRTMLQESAAAVVRHLDALWASIWTLTEEGSMLQLEAHAASADFSDHAADALRIGEVLVAAIASAGQPSVASDIVADTRLADRGWMLREGVVGYAGYPLIVDGRVVGVIGVFSRHRVESVVTDALAAAADTIALGIRRKRVELDVAQRERRFRSLTMNASDLVLVVDPQGIIRYASPSHERVLGYRPEEVVGRDAFEFIHPDDFANTRSKFDTAAVTAGRSRTVEYRMRCADGSWRVLEGIGNNLVDDEAVRGVVINAWDITHRKQAEERTAALLEVAQDLAGSVDTEQMLERVQRRAIGMLQCDAVGTFALDDGAGMFRLIGQRGMWDALLSVAASSDLRRGRVFGGLTASGERLVINDFAEFPDVIRSVARQCGIGALIAAPLHGRDRQLGAFVVFRTLERPPFAADHAELCHGIAKQLGVALDAHELHQRRQEEAAVSRSLARAAKELIAALGQEGLLDHFCRVTTEVLECDISATLLRQPDDTWAAVATAGWAPEDREAVLAVAVPDVAMAELLPQLERGEVVMLQLGAGSLRASVRQRAETLLCVALSHGGRVIGMHTAGYFHRLPDLTPVQRRIGLGLADLASLALDNARLIEHLDRANRLKSDFVGTMSHELRTPLNIIMGYVELLRAGEFGALAEEQAETLGRVDKQAHQLLDLVNATLDLNRLESGRAPLEFSDVSLADLFAELQRDLQPLGERTTLALHWPALAPDLALRSDRTKLKVIVKNLIDNAMKFTEEGSVVIDARRADGAVRIIVTDTGIGIPAESHETIFESFRQLEPSLTRRFGGVGLGLYVVRRLVDLIGGTIGVESELGRGSTFCVELPVTPPAAIDRAHARVRSSETVPARRGANPPTRPARGHAAARRSV